LKIKSSFEESIQVKKKVIEDGLLNLLCESADLISDSILKGGKLMICGNGGSAADAQHLVAEFLIRLTSEVNRPGIPAITLLQDPSTFTACVNDFNSEEIFSRNLVTLAKPEDVVLVLTTSGNSPNILKVLKEAKKIGIKTIGFLGSGGGEAKNKCDIFFIVPSNNTARIQEVHITAGHATLDYVETKLIEKGFFDNKK